MSYSYGASDGPHTWAKHFPHASGQSQSPININTMTAVLEPVAGKLKISMKRMNAQTLTRREHNFQVGIEGECVLTGGPLDQVEYKLVQFHFHWGSGDTWGSEHLINGVGHPCELHCVFMNTNYPSFEEALKHKDGLSVIGIFLELGPKENDGLKKLCRYLPKVQIGESFSLPDLIDIVTLFPDDLSKYYTYQGSLTTPPFSECVTWIVLSDPITITKQQLTVLRSSHVDCSACDSTDNFRTICPVGKRKVISSFNPPTTYK